jgi:hypothetical protein
MEQQPLQEELCNGDATSLVSAPCGDGFQTARVLTHPLRMLCDREGVFLCRVPPLVTRPPHAARPRPWTAEAFTLPSRA